MERSFANFIKESMASVFHIADSKIGRSLWTLARRPGALTKAYMKGKRVPYLHPFRVFLVANVIFFLFHSLIGHSPITTRLATHISSENFFHDSVARRLVEHHIEENELTYTEYEAQFNRRVETFSKTLVFVMIPALMIVLSVLLFWRKEFVVKHLAFSSHAFGHLLLFNFVIIMIINKLVEPLQETMSSDFWETVFSTLSITILIGFFFSGLRRAYDLNTWVSALLSLLLAGTIYLMLQLYRALLFFAAFYLP